MSVAGVSATTTAYAAYGSTAKTDSKAAAQEKKKLRTHLARYTRKRLLTARTNRPIRSIR